MSKSEQVDLKVDELTEQLTDRVTTRYGESFAQVLSKHLGPTDVRKKSSSRELSVDRFWKVREAKNRLSKILDEARSGEMQVVFNAREEEEPVVMLSLDELHEIYQAGSQRRSLADMLAINDEMPPIPTADIEIKMGVPAQKLVEL